MAGHWPRPSVCAGLGRVFGLVALPAPVNYRLDYNLNQRLGDPEGSD